VLREAAHVPKRMVSAVVSRVKIMSDLNIAEKRVPQDGRVSISIEERRIDLRITTLPTQRGEAGAPLLNFKGEVIGMLVSSLENNSSCYALPIDAAEKIRSDFVRFGEVRHGWIGANVSDAKEATDGSRAKVTEILDTPASDAGIKPGDVLLQVGRTKVKEPEDVLDASFFLTAGDTVPITVVRGGEKVTFNVQADVHPASKNLPVYPDGRRMPMSATFSPNRAIPLNLQSVPP